MTSAKLIKQCKALAPDFVVERKTITVQGHVQVYASCTVRGEPLELSVIVPPNVKADCEGQMLRACLESIRRRIAR